MAAGGSTLTPRLVCAKPWAKPTQRLIRRCNLTGEASNTQPQPPECIATKPSTKG